MQSIANIVNSVSLFLFDLIQMFQLYAPLNIRVILVWADIWKDGDLVEITENSDASLGNFLRYRKETLLAHSHDNAQLLT